MDTGTVHILAVGKHKTCINGVLAKNRALGHIETNVRSYGVQSLK